MSKVTANMSMSLNGFIAGPNISVDNPVGEGGGRLHEWMFPPKGNYQKVAEEMFEKSGQGPAVILVNGAF